MAEKRAAEVIPIKEAARITSGRTARIKAAERATRKERPGRRASDPRWIALLRLLLVIALALGALLLVRELRSASQLQDCVMSGRTNCAPIDTKPPAGAPSD